VEAAAARVGAKQNVGLLVKKKITIEHKEMRQI
jgi:hypothetical protein